MRRCDVEVVVPARNEELLLPIALRSIRSAIRAVDRLSHSGRAVFPGGCFPAAMLETTAVRVRLTVVADRCTDRTVDIARNWADRVLEVDSGSPGIARAHGFQPVGAGSSADVEPWLLCTDADSSVPEGWIIEHLLHRQAGAEVVAGTVKVVDWADRDTSLVSRYRREYASRQDHVHGTNLGISAAAYGLVGGFRPLDVGEDQDLVDRCRLLGLRTHWCTTAPVITSARRAARAADGFAGYLTELENT